MVGVCRYWAARNTCPKCNYRWTNDLTSSVMNLRKVQPFNGTVPRNTKIWSHAGFRLIRGSFKNVGFIPFFQRLHCKKWLSIFPSPAGMSLTKISLAGKNLNIPGQREFD